MGVALQRHVHLKHGDRLDLAFCTAATEWRNFASVALVGHQRDEVAVLKRKHGLEQCMRVAAGKHGLDALLF